MQRTDNSEQRTAKPLKIYIAGGGTGGHVIPALAIGRALHDNYAADVRFVGTANGLETKLVPEAGFPLELVRSGKLKNVSLATRLRTMLDLPLGVLHCVKLLRAFKPDAVVGVGGYASGPAMIAAVLLRVPTLAYEPNAAPGLANRIVGKHVSAAAVSYAETTKFFRNATVTGVPVRAAIFAIPALTTAMSPRLLITAGSQGAAIFNDTLPRIAVRLLAMVQGLTIVHQAGPKHVVATQAAYEISGADTARWQVSAFLDDMPTQYAAATLVLARSGSTVAELAAAGRPSLLVPFAGAADDHQRRNAEVMVRAGAAKMLLQKDASDEQLLADLVSLLNDRPLLRSMGQSAKVLAHPGALERITALVVQLARKPQSQN